MSALLSVSSMRNTFIDQLVFVFLGGVTSYKVVRGGEIEADASLNLYVLCKTGKNCRLYLSIFVSIFIIISSNFSRLSGNNSY